jgi:phage recombination protein Bet
MLKRAERPNTHTHMSTQTLIKQNNQLAQSWTNEQIELVKNTVAKNSTDAELQMFMHLASRYNLDPFAKEIWFIKYKNGDSPSIFTSRDGYLKIAHASGVFDGMESFTIDDDKGNPIKAICKVFRKDMSRPFHAEIKVSEYRQNSPTWSKYPSAMAIKVAEVFALKRAFSISGLVTREEMPTAEEADNKTNVYLHPDKLSDKYISPGQVLRLHTISKAEIDTETGEAYPLPRWTAEQAKDYLLSLGIKSSKEIPANLYDPIVETFKQAAFWLDVPGQAKMEEV